MYSTNLTQTQWQFIKRTLEFDDRKRKHDLRIIWNALNYLVKTGCQWRMLPLDFPKWQLVYYYYSKWSDLEVFDLLLSRLREKVRMERGQNAVASLGIMNSQSVRWGNNRSVNGWDGNKKVKGIKRHVVVDKNGFLLAVIVSVANVHDSKAAVLPMKTLKYLLILLQLILADGGYRGNIIEEIKTDFNYAIQVVMRSDSSKKGFDLIKVDHRTDFFLV